MRSAKVAVSIDERLLREVDRWVAAGDFPSQAGRSKPGRAQRASHPLGWKIPAGTGEAVLGQISQVRALSVERLERRIARFEDEAVGEIVDGLFELVG